MKKFAILRKDRTILVKTPKPYVVDAYNYSDNRLKEVVHELNEHTKFLYDCLKLLKISKKEAILKDFTLNIETGDALATLSFVSNSISHEMSMVIFNHNW